MAALDTTQLKSIRAEFGNVTNPWRACAVSTWSVCLCVATTILALQTRRLMSDTNSFSTTSARKIKW